MNTSTAMQAMIRDWEGCELTAYQDMVGVWTIGYGHTGPDVHEGQTITEDEADQLLANDLHKFEIAVANLVDAAPTTQQQADAMISFAYNLGAGALAKSEVLRFHKAGQYEDAAADFSQWDHAGGAVVEGLLRRRESEAAVYLNGAYS